VSELDDIEKGLWTGAEGADEALVRQYELYVRQAEQISARRHSASMVFIVVSLALVIVGAFFGERLSGAGAAAFYLAVVFARAILPQSQFGKIQSHRADGKTPAGLALLGGGMESARRGKRLAHLYSRLGD